MGIKKKEQNQKDFEEIEPTRRSAQSVRNYYMNLNIESIDRKKTASEKRDLYNDRSLRKRKLLQEGKKITWNHPNTKFKPVLVIKA